MHSVPLGYICSNFLFFCAVQCLIQWNNWIAIDTVDSADQHLSVLLDRSCTLCDLISLHIKGRGDTNKWSTSSFGFLHYVCTILFSTHIWPMSTQHKHIMVAFLYHMKNMTSHFNGCVTTKFAFWKGYPYANQFNFCSTCVNSVIFPPCG